MIQNINFPEGTNVVYQGGGRYDQFDKNVNIKTTTSDNTTLSDGMYVHSNLYSAKEFVNMQMDYCFYNSNCVFRVKNTKSLSNTFANGKYMYDLIFDKDIPVVLTSAFNETRMLSFFTISANATNINNILAGYQSAYAAKYINWDIDTSELTYITAPFSQHTKALYGLFSIKKLSNINYSTITGYSTNNNLRCITLADIGTNSSQRTVDCSYWNVWGVDSSAIPEARQSLIDSLITYSYDRATAGYSTCTIKLSAKTKALLTEEEIAQITAKGYTIA